MPHPLISLLSLEWRSFKNLYFSPVRKSKWMISWPYPFTAVAHTCSLCWSESMTAGFHQILFSEFFFLWKLEDFPYFSAPFLAIHVDNIVCSTYTFSILIGTNWHILCQDPRRRDFDKISAFVFYWSALQMKGRWKSYICKCLVSIYVFPEIKLLLPKQNYKVLSPSSYTHLYCICEKFIYFLDRSAYSAAGKYVDQSWEYINRSQTHECGNWDWGGAIPRKGIHKWNFPCSASTAQREAFWHYTCCLRHQQFKNGSKLGCCLAHSDSDCMLYGRSRVSIPLRAPLHGDHSSQLSSEDIGADIVNCYVCY